jgi:hypothetical protein
MAPGGKLNRVARTAPGRTPPSEIITCCLLGNHNLGKLKIRLSGQPPGTGCSSKPASVAPPPPPEQFRDDSTGGRQVYRKPVGRRFDS